MARKELALDMLHNFIPLNGLSLQRLREVLVDCRIQSIPAGKLLFEYGSCDDNSVFLLSGKMQLIDHNQHKTELVASDPAANYELAAGRPRQFTVKALTPCNILAINQRRLYDALLWEQSLTGVAQNLFAELPLDVDRDWVLRLLQSHIFYRIPLANIVELLQAMMPVDVRKDQVVIRQGDAADCCYFIHEGRAKVRVFEHGEEVVLAYLSKGDYFGEEGLLQEAPRNADVVMLSDGVLMRLRKYAFDRLLKAPSLAAMSFSLAQSQVDLMDAMWLDVRLAEEYKQGHLRGAWHLPLQDIRVRAAHLPLNQHYIIYCDNSHRSAAAAFLLGVQGFNASILAGGLWSLTAAERARYWETA